VFWLGDFKQGGHQPEISLAKGIANVECEGHSLEKEVEHLGLRWAIPE
jgi:hypothetical protein